MNTISEPLDEGKQPATAANEARLRQLLSIGSVEGLSLLWDIHAESMFKALYAIVQSASDAEDILHNVFIKISKNSRKLAEAKNFNAYLFRLTRNAGIDAYKQLKKRRQHTSTDFLVDLPHGGIPTDTDKQQCIHQALQALPEEQRSVVTLKIYDDKTFAEISDMLDISANTCASRYRYAVEKLRALLKGVWP